MRDVHPSVCGPRTGIFNPKKPVTAWDGLPGQPERRVRTAALSDVPATRAGRGRMQAPQGEPVFLAAPTPPEGATVVSSRGCRRGPQDRGKPTARPQSGSSPTGGEWASARIRGTVVVRARGDARRVRRRTARDGSGPTASAVCATPRQGSDRFAALSGGLRCAPTPGYSLACLRHAGGAGASHPPPCARRGTATSSARNRPSGHGRAARGTGAPV